MENEHKMRLGDFLREFDGMSPDTIIQFGNGNLKLYRTKWRGDSLLQIEFDKLTWPSVYDADEMKAARKVGVEIP